MLDMTDAQKGEDEWVRITSQDGFSFLIKRKVAVGSGTLKNMLDADSSFAEAISGTCAINERAVVVEKMLEYLSHKKQYENAGAREEIHDFQERIPPEIALELLMAADYWEM